MPPPLSNVFKISLKIATVASVISKQQTVRTGLQGYFEPERKSRVSAGCMNTGPNTESCIRLPERD